MPKAASDHTEIELKNLIENYRAKGATDAPFYLEVLEEYDRRKARGLSFNKSFAIIRRAAEEGRFLSYKELADESGCEWSRVHHAIGPHLGDLVEFAHRRGWPMLSAIVVNKQNVETGEMEPDTLKGFAAAARWLGYAVTDERGFLREQQERVFDWGKASPRSGKD